MANLFDRSKIMSHYNTIRQYCTDGTIPTPTMAIIYPTSICNYKCPGCLCAGANKDPSSLAVMPPDKLEKVIDELCSGGLRAVELAGGGEPLLHPQFSSLVLMLADRGLSLGLLTNGSLLDKVSDTALSKFTYIRVSLNGHSTASFEIMHGVRKLEQTLSAIANTRNRINTLPKTIRPTLGVKALVSQDNLYDLSLLVTQAQHLMVDYVQFKSLRNDPRELSAEQRKEAKRVLRELAADVSPFPVYDGIVNPKEKQRWSQSTACVSSILHTLIDSTGRIYICCYYSHREVPICFGNVFTDSFTSVWGGREHRRVLRELDVSECVAYDCRFCNYDSIFHQVIHNDSMHMDFL